MIDLLRGANAQLEWRIPPTRILFCPENKSQCGRTCRPGVPDKLMISHIHQKRFPEVWIYHLENIQWFTSEIMLTASRLSR